MVPLKLMNLFISISLFLLALIIIYKGPFSKLMNIGTKFDKGYIEIDGKTEIISSIISANKSLVIWPWEKIMYFFFCPTVGDLQSFS